ncbi:MAG TPA: DUF364 domain-containing protein [Bacteroidales bacterium]|nr:DUF364 domain-containing protein [Bacteroidales bacterium]HPT01763.1 DUF364 domain-containing protein [Bacteroidales bacterium]
MILQETYHLLETRYRKYLDNVSIEKVQAGIFLTAVQLSTGYCGVASTDLDSTVNCSSRQNRDFGDFTPGNIKGQNVTRLFQFPGDSRILDSVKLAALNAVSAGIILQSDYQIIEDRDPFDLLNLDGQKRICIVGAFQDYIKKLAGSGHQLHVLELNKDALTEEQQQYYVPAADAPAVIPVADIIILTGSTLVNNTLDNLLTLIPAGKQAVVVGPSSSLIPDILFKYNVSIIGATKITDPDRMFAIVAEGGLGYHLFHYCAKKICLINNLPPSER